MTGPAIILYPVKDIEASKERFTTVLEQPPTSDSPYYAGWTLGDLEIGLNPQGHASGMTGPVAFYPTPDIEAAVQTLVDAGAEVKQQPSAVGPGRKVAWVLDADGNPVGLVQDA